MNGMARCPLAHSGAPCRPGWVYVARIGGRWKLGYTESSLQNRRRTLAKHYSQETVIAIGLAVACAIGAESTLLRHYAALRLEAEFFAFTDVELGAIASLTSRNRHPVQREVLLPDLVHLLGPAEAHPAPQESAS